MNKKFVIILMAVLALATAFTASAQAPKRELRSGWLTTVSNMDWPSIRGTSATVVAQQKSELITILDAMKEANLNSVYFHTRNMCDAYYPSQYAPWSNYLTGARGTDPGWDPLAFFVEECHKRGMQALAWLNPYRYSGNTSATSVQHTSWNTSFDKTMQQHLINSNYYYTLKPSDPWTLQHLKNVVTELATNYDIDGIIFDDYFYPNNLAENSSAGDWSDYQNQGGGMSIGDWRRSVVNNMVKEVNNTLKSINPSLIFAISPAGIAGSAATSGNKYTSDGVTANPCNNDWQYNGIYSDPLAWLKAQSIDYISPQLYWATTHSTNAFGTQTDWWSKVANIYGRHNYPSHYVASGESTSSSSNIIRLDDQNTYSELKAEVDLTRQYTRNAAPGSVLFSIKWLATKPALRNYIKENIFTRPALHPAMSWLPKGNYTAPANLALNNYVLSWDKVTNDRGAHYAVYAIPTTLTLNKAKGADGIKGDYLIATPYTNSLDIASRYRNGYWFAVTAVDAAGNEYAPTVINEPDPGTLPDVKPSITKIEGLDYWKEVWKNTSTYNSARNLCYGDDYVFIATTDGHIYVLDAKTGVRVKELSTTGISGGTYSICGVQYVNGKIYACNLTTSPSSNPIKVYCWDGINAAPRNVLTATSGDLPRAGDHFGISGDPQSSGYFYFVNANKAVRYKMSGGAYTGTSQTTTLPITLGTTPHIDPVDDNSFWVTSTTNNPIRYNWITGGTATQAETTGSILGNTNGVAFAPFQMSDGKDYGFVVDYLGSGSVSGCANLIRKQNGSWNTGANVHLPQSGLGTTSNPNYGASVAVNLTNFGGATTQVDMWVLVTNQGIAHYKSVASDEIVHDNADRFYRVPCTGGQMGKKLMQLDMPQSSGTYAIKNYVNPSYRLDVNGGSSNNLTNVQVWKNSTQTFEIIHVSGDYYRIKPSYCDKCLDIYTGSTVGDGSNIHIYDYSTGDALKDQIWKFVRNDDGSYTIVSKYSDNLVLDINGGITTSTNVDGINVQLWTKNNSSAQKWILEPVSSSYVIPIRTVPDPYFVKYLYENGLAKVYNENIHEITGDATIAANFDTDVKVGSNEHIVVLSDEIVELNNMGHYGKLWTVDTDSYPKHFEGITNFKGMEYFVNLKRLELNRNIYGDDFDNYAGQYSVIRDGQLDLTYNTKLEWLDLDYAKLTEISNSKNASLNKLTNLKYLNLSNNEFTNFDMRPYTKLERLEMTHNFNMMRIDANRNDNLFELAIFDSMYGWDSNYSLQKLVNNFPNLAFLHAFATFTSDLDLSQHSKLQSIWLHNSIYGARQRPKGNWLHKLDLSGCTELRDIHVQNMHLPALNVPSSHIGEPLSDEYKDLQFSREVTNTATARGGKLNPYVQVENNYRHIQADLTKWQDPTTKKTYFVYYLRTQWTGEGANEPVMADKKGYYDVLKYTKYTDDKSQNDKTNWATSRVYLNSTMADDLFDGTKVMYAGTANSFNTIDAQGVLTHNARMDEGCTALCTVTDGYFDFPEMLPADVRGVFNGNVKGSIIILKAGIGEPYWYDAPSSIRYAYNIISNNTRSGEFVPDVYFYLDIDYPSIVTGVSDIDTTKEVSSIEYYNPAGIMSIVPFSGVNIVVIKYTDGTTQTKKIIK